MSIVGPLLPALVPLTTLLWLRAADHSISISRNNWDLEYDYIIGKCQVAGVFRLKIGDIHRIY